MNTDDIRALVASPKRTPLRTAIDVQKGEQIDVQLGDGTHVEVELIEVEELTDSLLHAVRDAQIKLRLNGEEGWIHSANYHLPVVLGGVQVDCPATSGYKKRRDDVWALDKDARIRLWPAGSPWIAPDTFTYPARQRWFATGTQMSNEPVFIDGGDFPKDTNIYYHEGLDIGGMEGMVDAISPVDGVVLEAGEDAIPSLDDLPISPRYDRVHLLDDRGWSYRFSHLKTIEPDIRPGAAVRSGQAIGLLGKEGSSGGWSHIHFGVFSRQPSGRWGPEEGYAFLWESYIRKYQPKVLAVARPHLIAEVGQAVTLDGRKSWCSDPSGISRYEWTLTDGSHAQGPTAEQTYQRPGCYSEILEVTDPEGNVDHDFAVVHVFDPERPDLRPPTVHGACSPTFPVRPGDPVIFAARSFRTEEGGETWDFGVGGPPVEVRSDGSAEKLAPDGYALTIHRYREPGDYLARVEHTATNGLKAMFHVKVRVATS